MANTVTYKAPVSGVTAPTRAQSAKVNQVKGTITGDGAATTVTIDHNLNISAADLAKGLPEVRLERILASGNTAAPIVSAKTAQQVTLTVTAFSGEGLAFTVDRESSLVR